MASRGMTDPSLITRKKGMNGCVMAVIGCAALFLLVACLYWVWCARCDRQFAQQLDEIRERGEPTSFEEMAAYYRLPDGAVDVTDDWVAATEVFATDGFKTEASPFPMVGDAGDEIPPAHTAWEQQAATEAFVERYRPQINAMHAAAARQGATLYDVPFEQGWNLNIDWEVVPTAIKLLAVEARLQSRRGNSDEVFRTLQTMFHCGETLEYGPFLMTQAIRHSCHSVTSDSIRFALEETELNDTQLRQLQSLFAKVDFKPSLRRAMMGERCFSIGVLKADAEELGVEPQMLWIKQDTELYLSLMQRVIDNIDKEYSAAHANMLAVDNDCRKAAASGDPRQAVLRVGFPALTGMFIGRVRSETECGLTAAGIAIKRFQLANKRLPNNLEELVPEYIAAVPTDPFNNDQPIQYLPTDDGTGFKIYSFGEDGVDDGGKALNASRDGDIVFSVMPTANNAEDPNDATGDSDNE